MNVILAIRKGIPDDPILIKKDDTAKAVYVDLAQKLGADLKPDEIMGIDLFSKVDRFLEPHGNELYWWEVPINKF